MDEITIVQNMIYELFTFYHRIIMILVGREDIRLGTHISDYIQGKINKYDDITEYVRFLNNVIFFIETGEENTRGPGYKLGYINLDLLDPMYIKNTFIPIINTKLSILKPNQITMEKFAEIINNVFFEIHDCVFQYDPIDLMEMHRRNTDMLGELRDYFNETIPIHHDKQNEFVKNKMVEYKSDHKSKMATRNIQDLIYIKTDRIYKKNINIWIRYVQKKRRELKTFLKPYPTDLYLNISIMMGIPELSRSMKSKSKSKSKTQKKNSGNREKK